MALGLKSNQSNIAVGLGTFSYTVQTAGIHQLSAVSSVLPPSGLSLVLQHNGSTIASSATPATAEQVVSAMAINIPCSVSDTLSIIISSSNANDKMLNTVKTIMQVGLTNA